MTVTSGYVLKLIRQFSRYQVYIPASDYLENLVPFFLNIFFSNFFISPRT